MTQRAFYSERVRRFAQRMETLLLHAFPYLDEVRTEQDMDPPVPDEIHLHSRPQSDGGREVQYCAVHDEGTGCTVVYRDWRFVRTLRNPSVGFWDALHGGRLPATNDPAAWDGFETAET